VLRRIALKILASGLLLALLGIRGNAAIVERVLPFRHGVASGDPLDDGVIIWTRVSVEGVRAAEVRWEVAGDPGMKHIVAGGKVITDADSDWTVKVDVRGLSPGQRYYYRFVHGDDASPIGRTRTLPAGSPDRVRLGVVSCSSYPTGFFHVYREIAARDDLDAVVHLGDYIYEYGLGQYATEFAEQLGRVPDPVHEIRTLADYRRRYAQYRSDADAQAMHAAHPMIAVWDDHEIANDAWTDGAENHNEGPEALEGDWRERRAVAIQAYFEWLPIRGKPSGRRPRIYREFRFGNLVDLVMLDTRLEGRDRQPDISETDGTRAGIDAVLNGAKRRLLGRRQERWLRRRLRRSRATWQALGQQVLVSPIRSPDLEPLLDPEKPSMLSPELLQLNIALSKSHPPLLLDTWDGYPWARQRLLGDIRRYGGNTVVLSGDLHTQLAGNLHVDGDERPVSVEFMAGSVTSPGFAQYLPERAPGMVRDATLAMNPNLRYMDTDRRGWLCMTFTRAECVGEWHLVDSVTETTYTTWQDRALGVAAGRIGDGLYEA